MEGSAFVPESAHVHLDSPEGNARREVRRKSRLILYDAQKTLPFLKHYIILRLVIKLVVLETQLCL